MPWLRTDDVFPRHPKVIGLKRADRWTWFEVLSYCAEHRTGGHVPAGINEALPYVTAAFIKRCRELGLLDDRDGRLQVHDWAIYNGSSIGDRVAAFLAGQPDATGNEVHRALGGKRETVLATVAQLRQSGSGFGSQSSSRSGTPPVPDRYQSGSETGSPRARARTPAPTPEVQDPPSHPELATPRDERAGGRQAGRSEEEQARIDAVDAANGWADVGAEADAQLERLRSIGGER